MWYVYVDFMFSCPIVGSFSAMSRLDNNNMVCMAGICYGNTPCTTMKYMGKGLSFQPAPKVVTSTKSELEGKDQIATGILVHMATQIANALASCNFVHRDLATWNCMARPK